MKKFDKLYESVMKEDINEIRKFINSNDVKGIIISVDEEVNPINIVNLLNKYIDNIEDDLEALGPRAKEYLKSHIEEDVIEQLTDLLDGDDFVAGEILIQIKNEI